MAILHFFLVNYSLYLLLSMIINELRIREDMFICRLPEVSPLKLLKDYWKSGNGVGLGLGVYMCIWKGRGGEML